MQMFMQMLLQHFSFIQPFPGLFMYAEDLEMSESGSHGAQTEMIIIFFHRQSRTFVHVSVQEHTLPFFPLLDSLVNQCHCKSEAWGAMTGCIISSSGW